MKGDGLEQNRRATSPEIVDGYTSPTSELRTRESQINEEKSKPTVWFSDDEDVFVNTPRKANLDIGSTRECFSDDETIGEYSREKLMEARLVVLQEFYRIRCVGCSCLIREKDVMNVEGNNMYWHCSCFYCVVCGMILSAVRNGRGCMVRIIKWKLHCHNCYSTNGKHWLVM